MTRIFDDPAQFADEAIDGFVAANPRYVRRVDGGVVRSTVTPAGQTAVVIGGGSGHYPAFAGLVGPGLAAGAACGNMFASPAASQVYRVAKAGTPGGGVLLSYGNYAGDVLHFGQAQERLNAEGNRHPDRRGDRRHRQRTRRRTAQAPRHRGGSHACSRSPVRPPSAEPTWTRSSGSPSKRTCAPAPSEWRFRAPTLPGADAPLFTVPEGGMSLGLGIHGEPGISEHPMPTASELANRCLTGCSSTAQTTQAIGSSSWSTAWDRSSTTSCSCSSGRSPPPGRRGAHDHRPGGAASW